MLPEPALRLGVLVRHNSTLLLRDPGSLISYVAMPMLLMLVLKPLYESALAQGTQQVVIGPLVMFSILSLHIVGNSILMEREWHTWDRLRASPVGTTELLVGKTTPTFVMLLAQQTILFVYGCLVVGLPFPDHVLFLAVAILVWSLALLAIGAALATVMRSHGELGAAADVGALTLSALGGALLPVSMMPGWVQTAAHFSPGFWAIELLRAAIAGDTGAALAPTAVLLAVALACGGFAVARIRRGWGRSTLL